MSENKKQGGRKGDVATVYFLSTVGSGPMFIDHGDKLLFQVLQDKVGALRVQKKDGRAYLIPLSSVAFVRFEPGSIESEEEGPDTEEGVEDGSETA